MYLRSSKKQLQKRNRLIPPEVVSITGIGGHNDRNLHKKLIMEKDYENMGIFSGFNTQLLSYNSSGLLESQTYETSTGKKFYFKHFYTKQ